MVQQNCDILCCAQYGANLNMLPVNGTSRYFVQFNYMMLKLIAALFTTM